MIKIIFFFLMVLLVVPAFFVSDAIGQDIDCRSIRDELRSMNSEYRSQHDEYRKAYNKFREYHTQIYKDEYKATGKPLIDTYRRCQKEGTEKEAFCKGTIEDYNNISAKKKTAKEQSDAAKAISDKSKQKYNDYKAKAVEMGCVKSKEKSKEKDK